MNDTLATPRRRIIGRELVIVIIVVGLAIMGMSLLQPVLPLYLTSLGMTPAVIGLMLSTGMAGMVIGESSGGWLADRAGARLPLFIGTFMCVPMLISFVFARGTGIMFVIFFFWGLVRSALFGPGRGYIGTHVPFTHKATVMAIYGTAMAGARSLGSFSSGFIVDGLGYEAAFIIAAGIAAAAGVLVLAGMNRSRTRPETPVAATEIQAGRPPSHDPPEGRRNFIYQSVIAAFYFTAIGVFPFVSLLASQVARLSASQIGMLFTTGAVVNAVLLIPMGRLADRRSKRAMMAVGLLTTAAGQAIIAVSTTFPALALGGVVQSTGGAIFGPAAVALLSENVPLRKQNTAMGIYGGCEDIGIIIGSAVGGAVWAALGPTPTFLLIGTVPAAIGAAMCLVLLRPKPRATPLR